MSGKYERELKVFVLQPGLPAGPPRPGAVLHVEAASIDDLLAAAKRALAGAGYDRHRAISFTPNGLVAYVEEAP